MSHRLTCAAFVLVGVDRQSAAASAQAAAQPPADAQALRAAIDDLKKDFEARLSALETRLAAIEGRRRRPQQPCRHARGSRRAEAPAAVREPARRQPASVEGVQPGHGGHRRFPRRRRASQHRSGQRRPPHPAFEMHESEASFQAVVDPYARADFFISFGEEGVDLEEGFITLHVAARAAC